MQIVNGRACEEVDAAVFLTYPFCQVEKCGNGGHNENVVKSASNIPGAKVLHVDSINVLDLVHHDHVVATPAVLQKLEEVYAR